MKCWGALTGLMVLLATTAVASAEGDPENGKLVSGRCTNCHGDGNARSTSFQVVPMLAGQPASYLVKEMQNYANGSREDTSRNGRMSEILRSLEPQDLEDIAAYFEAQKRY
ncbi:MAG: c-type cytochrome [Silicimonas sp.]|nr:c-type cytochrome [Silicimonas sp.]